ncbi:restriction endonuclease subunit S [Melissococcus sp. OM08-11BH]|uniref:restriction endonuclease subunit S n=1 Tax=Melissococcus sp. OM08-11BH TaxID=2293110 RepID=UPI0018F6C9BF|nr:restriction endonuclease subunit S [Melissococcus sp. OM08-11BH]
MTRNMKDSGVEWIGDIPEDWEIIKTKRKFKTNKTIVGDKYTNFDRLSLTLNGVLKRPFDDNKGLQPQNLKTYQILNESDLIFKLIDLENVKTSRVGYSNYQGLVSPVYIRLINPTETRFGYYYYMNMWYQEIFNALGAGVRSSLSATDLLNIPYIFISSVKEKHNIVEFLDKKINQINTIISDTQQSIIELKKYKQSLITETVTKGLDKTVEMKDSGIEVLGKINKDFRIISLGYLGNFQNGISKSGDSFGKGYPFVSYSDVYKNRVLPKKTTNLVQSTIEEQKNYSVRKNDIFFTRTSEIIEEIGMSSACYETIEQATFSGFVIRFRPNVNIFLVKFLRYFLEGSFVREYFSKEMNIVTRASLGQGLLKKLPIVLPSLEEQQQIVEFLDNKTSKIDSLIADKEKMITEYELYKKSLIYEYVTGKKQV